MATLGNPKNTIEVLQKYNFNFQKKFGQNFLINTGILENIIEAAEITKDDFVLEIGPGIGTMTQYLCESAREVVAVEIDKNLIPILEDTLSAYDNVEVLNDDILKVDIKALAEERNAGKPIKVVANLPYYITTPIIMGLFEKKVPLESITVMVQKEVADRMQVGPGTKDYGALSLAVQYYAEPYIVANVPPNCFMPRPSVGSAVIRLTRHQEMPVQVKDEQLMFKLIRASFNQRRKTLANGLKNSAELNLSKEVIEQAIQQLGKGGSVDDHGYVLGIEHNAVFVVIDIGAVLEVPGAACNGEGNDAQILPRRMIDASRVTLVFRAKLALGIARLGRIFCCCDGLGVLLRLGKVDGDIQITVFRRRLPSHVLLDAITADVIRIL